MSRVKVGECNIYRDWTYVQCYKNNKINNEICVNVNEEFTFGPSLSHSRHMSNQAMDSVIGNASTKTIWEFVKH